MIFKFSWVFYSFIIFKFFDYETKPFTKASLLTAFITLHTDPPSKVWFLFINLFVSEKRRPAATMQIILIQTALELNHLDVSEGESPRDQNDLDNYLHYLSQSAKSGLNYWPWRAFEGGISEKSKHSEYLTIFFPLDSQAHVMEKVKDLDNQESLRPRRNLMLNILIETYNLFKKKKKKEKTLQELSMFCSRSHDK